MKMLWVHGWGLEPTFWGNLEPLVSDGTFECSHADLGFYGSLSLPSGEFDVAIGHSLGVAWLLASDTVRFERLVSINGFSCFTAKDDFPYGWNDRILKRMQRGLAADYKKVLQQFFENAQAAEFPEVHELDSKNVDLDRLDWGLGALINCDVREQWTSFDGPQCVIAATDDQIVTAEQTRSCFADSDIHWIESNSHCLPLQHPDQCAALVREWFAAN